MKKLLLITMSILTFGMMIVDTAMAQDLRVFTGKYKSVDCELDMGDIDRAYISIENPPRGKTLKIHFYDEVGNYAVDEFSLVTGKIPFKAYSWKKRGTSEYIFNWISPTHLVFLLESKHDGKNDLRTLGSLELKGSLLTYFGSDNTSERDAKCVLRKVKF